MTMRTGLLAERGDYTLWLVERGGDEWDGPARLVYEVREHDHYIVQDQAFEGGDMSPTVKTGWVNAYRMFRYWARDEDQRAQREGAAS